jgi:hypothetical protein
MTNEDVKRMGGPAFPTHDRTQWVGMTLRDYFAAKALPAVYSDATLEAAKGSGLFSDENWRMGIALDAYMMADAMLKAREMK